MHQKKRKQETQEKPSPDLEITTEEGNYLVNYDAYSATVLEERGNDETIEVGLYKAASRKWESNDIPPSVQSQVELLYSKT